VGGAIDATGFLALEAGINEDGNEGGNTSLPLARVRSFIICGG